jgi:hypothetical protein
LTLHLEATSKPHGLTDLNAASNRARGSGSRSHPGHRSDEPRQKP